MEDQVDWGREVTQPMTLIEPVTDVSVSGYIMDTNNTS